MLLFLSFTAAAQTKKEVKPPPPVEYELSDGATLVFDFSFSDKKKIDLHLTLRCADGQHVKASAWSGLGWDGDMVSFTTIARQEAVEHFVLFGLGPKEKVTTAVHAAVSEFGQASTQDAQMYRAINRLRAELDDQYQKAAVVDPSAAHESVVELAAILKSYLPPSAPLAQRPMG